MGAVGRLRSVREELRAIGRLLKAAPLLRAGAHTSISTLLALRAQEMPEQTALLFEGRRWSWREVDQAANRWARALRARGVRSGSVVALVMDNRPEYLFAQSALVRLGAVVAFVNSHLSGEALAHAIRVSGASAVIAGTEHRETVAALHEALPSIPASRWWLVGEGAAAQPGDTLDADIAARSSEPVMGPPAARDDTGCYIYTSGTTGLPKAAIVTHRRWMLVSAGFAFSMAEATDDDVVYCTLPLYHSSGQFAGWGVSLFSGATLLLRRRFSTREFWPDVHRYGATVFIYIGELCRYLMTPEPGALERGHRLRLAMGNGLRETLWAPFQKRFGIPLVREFYGATEGNVGLLNYEGRPGYVGRLRPGMAVLACDPDSGEPLRDARGRCRRVREGETGLIVGRIGLLARFDGYLDKKATDRKILTGVFSRRDSWFNTGDLVRLDADGWVAFADRAGDNYRWKGENISATEVEAALHGCPGLSEAIVYGVEVPGSEGRAGMAALITDDSFRIEAFTLWVRERVPTYQQPRFVRILGEAARTTGTFKYRKADYRSEGYDPSRIADPLYVRHLGDYRRFDAVTHGDMAGGRYRVD
ncbi:MAG: long-chain-acyl-CoA synthetase [Pseudomonadota bacterium]